MSKLNVKTVMIAVIILVVIIAAVVLFLGPQVKLPKQVQINTNNQPTLGNPKAKIHIVAFEDFKCHNCMRYNVQILPTIKKQYIDTGKAKYTVINLAFVPGSMPAANAARCLYKQNKQFFFPYVKRIYNQQPPETENWATIPKLVSLANHISGVDKEKLSQCIYKSPYTRFINNNLKIAMSIMNGSVATPAIYINGYIVTPLTMRRFKEIMSSAE